MSAIFQFQRDKFRKMRFILAVIAVLASMHVMPAIANNDKTSPGQTVSEGSRASRGAQGNNAEDNKPQKAKKPDVPPKSTGNSASAGGEETPADDQDDALRAVEAHEALPLVRIVSVVEAASRAQVVDARLVRLGAALLYHLTLLNDAGRSWRAYYDARSGHLVAMN